MSTSPFHGIFSSLGQDTSSLTAAKVQPQEESARAPVAPRSNVAQTGQIAVDIYEQDHYYIIRAPIAGVKLSDLDIEVDGKVVTIRGTRRLSDDIDEDQYYLQECFWGEFSRSITLPCTIDPKKIKATFSKDCVLKVIIPREEKVKIVRINEGG